MSRITFLLLAVLAFVLALSLVACNAALSREFSVADWVMFGMFVFAGAVYFTLWWCYERPHGGR